MYANMYGISQVTEIVPGLYLTSVYGATKENIIRKNVSLLVNSAQELPRQDIPGVESVKIFLDDTPYAMINIYFDRMADKMNEHMLRGGRVLVHCMLGVSRSTSLVLAYLMKYRNMSLKSSYDLVVSKRSCARPNPGFWRQLVDYEKKLFSSNYPKNETPIPISIVSSSRSRTGFAPRYASAGPTRRYTSQSAKSPFETNTNTTSAVHTYLNNSGSPLMSHRSSLYVNPENRYLQKSSDFITTYRSSYNKYM